ncbi:STAS domain-containing protein [Sphaerisporangium perillae]|uniref:STAS domain-containing protein n=1 Tax=Sphaerisporangium perillae TaxID=2935860 RepID=UPI00200DACA9|nr:STAS domain-containing protein [Sphaerisporangium perillae]
MQFGAEPQAGFIVSTGVRQGAVVVQIQGELDYRSALVLRDELARAWEILGISAVILDMGAVTFCDSVGLSELIAALRRSKATGHVLMISGVQGTLLRVLTITGLRNAFDTYETVEEAMLGVTAAPAPASGSPQSDDSQPPDAATTAAAPQA